MSEERGPYQVRKQVEVPDGPTYRELADFLARHQKTPTEAGRVCGINGRTMRRYLIDPATEADLPIEKRHGRQMNWPAWSILRLLFGELTLAGLQREARLRAGADTDGKGDE